MAEQSPVRERWTEECRLPVELDTTDPTCQASTLASPRLTDEEAETIRRKLAERWRGPVLLLWLEQLLKDRDERLQREREAEEPPP